MQSEHLDETTFFDSVVVGGGTAGLSAALALGRARRSVLIVDTGLPRNRFADQMHTVLGNEGLDPRELARKGRAEVAAYGVDFADAAVTDVAEISGEKGAPRRLALSLSNGRELITRSIIAASGLTDILPDTPGLADRWGKTVLHCPYCHGWEFAGQRIAVLALSSAALHQIELLRQWTDDLTFLSAGVGELELETVLRLESRGIIIEPSVVAELQGKHPTGPVTARLKEGNPREFDAIFTFADVTPNDQWLESLALGRMDTPVGSFLAVDQFGKTSHDRIWAAGNICSPMANVPMSSSAGVMAGASANMALVSEDFDLADPVGP